MSIRIDSRTTASLLAAALAAILNLAWVDVSAAQPMGSSTATTEKFCNFGMAKGEAQHSCDVPFPAGCAVAHIPGTNQPMSTISKGVYQMSRVRSCNPTFLFSPPLKGRRPVAS